MRLSEEMMKYIIGVPLFVYTSSDEAMDGSMHTFTTAYVVNTRTRDIAEYYFEEPFLNTYDDMELKAYVLSYKMGFINRKSYVKEVYLND